MGSHIPAIVSDDSPLKKPTTRRRKRGTTSGTKKQSAGGDPAAHSARYGDHSAWPRGRTNPHDAGAGSDLVRESRSGWRLLIAPSIPCGFDPHPEHGVTRRANEWSSDAPAADPADIFKKGGLEHVNCAIVNNGFPRRWPIVRS